MAKRLVLLGPDPANGSYSTFNYFRTCAEKLGGITGELSVVAKCPANRCIGSLEVEGRAKVWARNYIHWPLRLIKMEADAYHIVDQGLAWYGELLRKGARFITVHDLINYLTYLGKLPLAPLSWRRKFFVRKCVTEIRRADHVFAISEFTASSLMKYLDLHARKITVTPNCADPRFRVCSNAEKGLARARLFGNDEYVIVCVSSSAGYKNRLGTLRVFNSLKKRLDCVQLHIAGGKASEIEKAYIEECRLQKSVHYWGQLPVEDLVCFYNGADALIFTSLYEGFGLPPLEAMQCGCPVVSTTCASLREVVGSAALTVDNPAAVEMMAEYLQKVLKDEALCRNLRALGLRQASRFTVERSMRSIAEVYQRLLA